MNQTLPAPAFDLRSRTRAALLHFGLSVLVAALAAALVFGFWYPMPYREISGGRELFLLIVAIDVVVGPLLTFAVFDRRKPRRELTRDLAVIVVLQIAALGYGLYTVERARPAVVALEGQRLRVVRAIELDASELAKAPPGLREIPWFGHLEVAARPSVTGKEQLDSVARALEGVDLGQRPERWRPPEQTAGAVRDAALPLNELRRRYPERAAVLDAAVAATGRPEAQLKYLPLLARQTDWVALIDAETGKIVGHAHLDGF